MKLVSVAALHAMPAGTIFSHAVEESPHYCEGIYRKGESNEQVTAINFAKLELLPQPLKDDNASPRVCRCRHASADQTLYGVGLDDTGDRFWVWEADDIRSLIGVLSASLDAVHSVGLASPSAGVSVSLPAPSPTGSPS